MKRNLLFIITILVTACVSNNRTGNAQGQQDVWGGIYSHEQTERGKVIYSEHCEICHAADMRGGPGSRSIVGIEFQFLWKEKSLGQLFETVRAKMPPGKTGILTDQEYIDVLTTILKANGFPEGNMELPVDMVLLNKTLLTWDKP